MSEKENRRIAESKWNSFAILKAARGIDDPGGKNRGWTEGKRTNPETRGTQVGGSNLKKNSLR